MRLLRTKESHLFQPFLIGEVFLSPHHPCQPVLGLFLEVHISLVHGETRTGHGIPDMFPQYWQRCFVQPRTRMADLDVRVIAGLWATCRPRMPVSLSAELFLIQWTSSMYWCMGSFLPSLQDFAFPLDEPHEVPLCPVLLPAKIHLICSTSVWYITHSSELCIICNTAELLCPSIQTFSGDTKKDWTQYWSLGCTTSSMPPAGLCATDHNPVHGSSPSGPCWQF